MYRKITDYKVFDNGKSVKILIDDDNRLIVNNQKTGFIFLNEEDKQEYLIMKKGIGFGKKIAERFEIDEEVQVYSLKNIKNKKETTSSVKEIEPIYLEVANMLLDETEKRIGKVERSVLIPLADHIDFAVRRLKESVIHWHLILRHYFIWNIK